MTVKVTLSIPDELAERIEKYRDRLNQSATFAEAIRKELATLELKEDLGDISATLARLRPQQEEFSKEPHRIGYRVGVGWARDTATYDQLLALANTLRRHGQDAVGKQALENHNGLRNAAYNALAEAGYLTLGRSDDGPFVVSTGQEGTVLVWTRVKPFDEEHLQAGIAEGILAVWQAVNKSL